MGGFEIRAAPVQGVPNSAEIVIGGPVGAQDARVLKDALGRQLAAGAVHVAILMKQVGYMNSAGLACLMELSASLERRGAVLVLVEVQPKVKVVLSNLGMNRFFRFEAGQEEARAFLRAQHDRLRRMPRLVPLDGPDTGVPFPLGQSPLRIGSDPKCAIVVNHPEAERVHAEVSMDGGRCTVKDLGSRSGTFVGDRKVTECPLSAGDVIRVADRRISYRPPCA